MADAPKLSPLARFIHTLREEKIRFQVVGMSAAILQGTPSTTIDTDLWIDLPARQYVKLLTMAEKQRAVIRANTVVELSDGSLLNFLYRVDGLKTFDHEYHNSKKIFWLGQWVRVLPLERIVKSKQFVARPKDLAQLPLLAQTIKLNRALTRVKKISA